LKVMPTFGLASFSEHVCFIIALIHIQEAEKGKNLFEPMILR